MVRIILILSLICQIGYGQYGLLVNNFVSQDIATTEFITEWEIPSGSFTILAADLGIYNATIDWGDSSALSIITTYNDADLTHTYTTTGTRQIIINGTFPHFRIGNSATIRSLITKVIQWGDVEWLSTESSFQGTDNLTVLPTGAMTGISGVITMQRMFQISSVPYLPDGFLDLAVNVENLVQFCDQATSLATIPSNLLQYMPVLNNLNSAFRLCTSLVVDISNFFDWSVGLVSCKNTFEASGLITSSSGTPWLNPSGSLLYTLTAPDYDAGIPDGQDCFASTNVSDIASTPLYWK